MDYFLDQRLIEEENMLAPSLKQFSLRVEILPSYMPVRVAEKILFVGESVQMFENQNVNLTRKGRTLPAQCTPSSQAPLTWHCVAPKVHLVTAIGWWCLCTETQHNHDTLAWEAGKEWHHQGQGTLAHPGCSLSSCDSAFLWQCLPVLQDLFWKTRRTLLLPSCIVSSSSHCSAWWTLSRWLIVSAALWPRLVFYHLFP